ncbi:MAG: hypothetical protein RDV48_22840 [Candidatus Eremiobacteraeota bacterium]|nr:hypothetical protein [Candidatus Eremiobacteraeota bacterium]
MKKYLAFLVLGAILFASMTAPLPAQDKEEKLTQCITRLSQIQAYLEFYFMGTGDYPKNLVDLESIFNEDVLKDTEKIKMPRDPATGKEFVYEAGKNYKSYSLSCPDPSQYGVKKLSLSPVPWGWMNVVAEGKSRRTRAQCCKGYEEVLTAAIKKFAEQNKKLPQDLKELVPKYMRLVPACPQCSKEYLYTVKGNDFVIGCPDPAEHGFTVFECTSREGFKFKPIEPPKKEPPVEKTTGK